MNQIPTQTNNIFDHKHRLNDAFVSDGKQIKSQIRFINSLMSEGWYRNTFLVSNYKTERKNYWGAFTLKPTSH